MAGLAMCFSNQHMRRETQLNGSDNGRWFDFAWLEIGLQRGSLNHSQSFWYEDCRKDTLQIFGLSLIDLLGGMESLIPNQGQACFVHA